ncbi:MAG TPA: hypothetical protein DCZ69_04265, partial [Syntrophobacteraceae bacterium]|nr:hypothetical protein [Syntrophobacteraceae bacterium]
MFLLIVCLLALLYTGQWPFAVVMVAVYFYHERRRSQPTPETFVSNSEGEAGSGSGGGTPRIDYTDKNVADLALLRFELERLLAEGAIDRTFHDGIVGSIGTLLSGIVDVTDAVEGGEVRLARRESAWELLIRHGMISPGPPPWRCEQQATKESSEETAPEPALEPLPELSSESGVRPRELFISDPIAVPLKSPSGVPAPPLSPETAAILEQTPAVPSPDASTKAPSISAEAEPCPGVATIAGTQAGDRTPPIESKTGLESPMGYAWQPKDPSALERALQAVSGWPAVVVPFLVQNIGWFIGGLCVVAGSVFLVSYTTGFAKALTVSLTLCAYTLFILWGGYQLRRRRPELKTSGSVLLALGVLLVPLNVAASVRVMTAGQHLSGLIIGIFTTAAISAGLYFATMLASGIMDRSLQGRHPQLFLGLSATQVALPLLERFPSWPLLAMLHILLLGLLAYGIVLFARDWLRSIFVERRKIAYYAAGTFVYAALVSFVHLTWGYSHPCDLPGGYYSPFLMVLCGLLFYLDAQLQRYTREHALLSRFNFAVYGFSILALALSADMPIARLVTLLIAVGLYGMVLWQYLTLPPLFLMLACLSWLYGMIVLQHVPNQWHMLASLPGLVGLFAAAYWLRTRQSSTLALGCYRMWMRATVLLTGWSLVHARPGMPAMGTALAAMALFFQGLRFAPGRLWFGGGKQTESAVNLLEGPWLYIVTVMGGVAVAYAPPWTVLPWAARSAFGLVLLAAVWTALGLRRYRSGPRVATAGMTVLFNSALLNVGLCLPLAVILGLPGVAVNRSLPLLLAAIGGVSLWLCLGLRFRILFYVVLGTWGVAGLVFKLTYFPKSGTGGAMMALA